MMLLWRNGMESSLYYERGLPIIAGCQRVFENGSFTEHNLAALSQAWRNRRNAQGCRVTSPRWFRRARLRFWLEGALGAELSSAT
jgi:hypothetical protein